MFDKLYIYKLTIDKIYGTMKLWFTYEKNNGYISKAIEFKLRKKNDGTKPNFGF